MINCGFDMSVKLPKTMCVKGSSIGITELNTSTPTKTELRSSPW